MKLLDGSLSGSGVVTEYGPKYGETVADLGIFTSDTKGVKIATTVDKASGKGGENAVWSDDGTTLTLNLVKDQTYTQKQIDDLIANATQPTDGLHLHDVTLTLTNGIHTAAAAINASTDGTKGGVRASSDAISLADLIANGTAAKGAIESSDTIQFIRNSYGKNATTDTVETIKINATTEPGKETVVLNGTDLEVSLATGKEYSEKDIEDILKANGFDYEVKLTAAAAPDSDYNGKITFNKQADAFVEVELANDGEGVGKDAVTTTGKGLTFQIGANGVEDQRVTLNVDDMSSGSLGVATADVSTREAANKAIDAVDAAVKKVSMQRAGLGALQNRLEYTVNNLTTTNENLTNAESQIRDTDMATEMINYTKFNILQQASQAMLAQANQQPQAVLQLLG